MKIQSVLLAVAAVGATAVTVGITVAPVHAAPLLRNQDVVITGRASDLPQAIVRYADLDLRSDADMGRLDRRIDRAARMLCGDTVPLHMRVNVPIQDCHLRVHASAEPQIKAVLASFDGAQRLALATAGALTLSAK